jgi:septin family protein
VKILVIGLRGTGKTQLIRSLLSMGSSSSDGSGSSSSSGSAASLPLDAFSGATKRVEVTQGKVLGVTLTMIDTPGLTASAAGAAANAAVLRKLRKAFQQHEPDLVLYVDRWVLLVYTLQHPPGFC